MNKHPLLTLLIFAIISVFCTESVMAQTTENVSIPVVKPPHKKNNLNKGVAKTNKRKFNKADQFFNDACKDTLPYKAANNLGVVAAAQGQSSVAIVHFNKSLQLQTSDPKVHYNSGLSFCRLQLLDAAQLEFDQAIDDVSPFLAGNKGVCFLKRGFNNEAINSFTTQLELEAEPQYRSELYYYRSIAHLQLEQTDSTIADLERSIEFNPGMMEPHINLGYVHACQREWGKSIKDYSKAIKIEEHNQIAEQGLADALLLNGEPEKARRTYKKMIGPTSRNYLYFPGSGKGLSGKFVLRRSGKNEICRSPEQEIVLQEILNGIGNTYSAERNYAMAMQYYDMVLRINKDNMEALTGKGHIFAYMGKYEAANEQYTQAILNQPDYHEALNGRGISRFRLQQYGAALDDLYLADLYAPKLYQNYDTFISKGFSSKALGDYKTADTQLSAAIALDSTNPVAYNGRGIIRYDKGNPNSALNDFNSAIELDGSNSDSYTNRGILYYHNRLFEKAHPDFCNALQIDSLHVMAYSGRGFTRMGMDKFEESLKDFTTAITLLPNTGILYSNRAWGMHGWALYKSAKDSMAAAEPYYADAYANLDTAMNLDIYNSYSFLNNRGVMRKDQGDYIGAVQDFGTSMSVVSLNNRAIVDAVQGFEAAAYHKLAEALPIAIADVEKSTILANRMELGKNMPIYGRN
jgi:tetratricopeptide (TPR) repeat protein